MCKNAVLLRDIIFKYDPLFAAPTAACEAARKIFLRDPADINIERMVEKIMAYIGGYARVGDCSSEGAHKDFSDGSECKTASIASKNYGTARNTYGFNISCVMSAAGNIKTGDLRVVLYNPHLDKCHYMYIPNSDIGTVLNISKTSRKMGDLRGSWNAKKNSFGKFDKYIVDSFATLATMSSILFEYHLKIREAIELGAIAGYAMVNNFEVRVNPYDPHKTGTSGLHRAWCKAYILAIRDTSKNR